MIKLTKHAQARCKDRGIREDWIKSVLQSPDKKEPDPDRLGVFRYYGAVSHQDNRILRVVAAPEGGQFRVITAFFDRAERRRCAVK